MSVDKAQTKAIIEQVIDKARQDETFKQELMTNPLTAIESATGESFKFPEGKELVFVDQSETPENTEGTYYLNIATYGDLEDMELSMEQLETIAGGGEDLPLPKIPWPIIIRL